MVRDFTQATKDRLSNEIDDINKKTWSPVTDFIGDIFLYGGKWLGILSLNDDMSNVESYQRRVLDMTDMTKKELNDIFDKVYGIDKTFKGYFSDINERIKTYNEKMKYLYGVIQPNFSICSAATISAETSLFNAQLKATDGKINGNFENELDWAAKEAALEATKGIVGSALKAVVDVVTLPVSMIKNVATGNPLGIVSDTWSIIDDVFAVGSNLVGVTALGLGYGISALTGSNETKHMAIQYGEAYGGSSGLTDTLKAEQEMNGESGVTDFMLKASKTMDNASAAFGLFSSAKGFLEDPTSMLDLKFGFKDKLGTIKKADMLEKYQDNYRTWQSLYRKFGKSTNYTTLKNISNGYKYVSGIWDIKDGADKVFESTAKTAFESSNKWFKSWGDAYDFQEDLWDFPGEDIFDALIKNNSVMGAVGSW